LWCHRFESLRAVRVLALAVGSVSTSTVLVNAKPGGRRPRSRRCARGVRPLRAGASVRGRVEELDLVPADSLPPTTMIRPRIVAAAMPRRGVRSAGSCRQRRAAGVVRLDDAEVAPALDGICQRPSSRHGRGRARRRALTWAGMRCPGAAIASGLRSQERPACAGDLALLSGGEGFEPSAGVAPTTIFETARSRSGR
jgi:hypothetical protein